MSETLNNKCNHDIQWKYSDYKGVVPMKYHGFCKKCKCLFEKEGKNGEPKPIREKVK